MSGLRVSKRAVGEADLLQGAAGEIRVKKRDRDLWFSPRGPRAAS